MMILNLLISFSLALALPAQPSHDLASLAAPATTAEARSHLLELGRSDPSVRALLSSNLPAMLLAAKDPEVVRSEAQLAGALKIEAAIPSLIQLLSGRNQNGIGGLSATYELENDPVARALYDIGSPALPALTNALKSDNRETRERTEAILILMNTSQTRDILGQHLRSEPDAQLRAYLRANGIKDK
jgi:HEAT repeat protein